MRKLTKAQRKFKEAIEENIDDIKWQTTDYLNFRFHFPTKDKFHLEIIEDGVSHLHIRGTFDETDISSIDSISNKATLSTFQVVMNVLMEIL